jgi:16S rRNA (guanine966-N2)-methyltransferase
MRIVAGRFGGRPLRGPTSNAIRPTSDRLRESLFAILEHGYGDPLSGARIIDVFAGTGAVALEALSRGASFALMVEDGTEARALIRDNVESLGVGGETRIFRRDARKLGDAPSGDPFDLAFLDPPYGKGLGELALGALRDGGWVKPDGLFIVEEAASTVFQDPAGFERLEQRSFGDTTVYFLRQTSP